MIIAQYKPTAIAQAPEAISDVINKYTDHNSYVIGYSYANKVMVPETDIVHHHNRLIKTDKKSVIQFHSEPFRGELTATCPKLVIAQYHATLPEYWGCTIVRNPIDLYGDIFFPKYQQDVIRIGYSPSTLKPGSEWADKGYVETIPILNEIKRIYKDKVEIDIITGVPLEECLKRKSLCNIFIDEVKTTSYHRSGLEAMAMGSATICSIGIQVEKVLLSSSGAKKNPFINVYHQDLKNKLIELIDSGLNNILEIGYSSRVWMEKYWDPRTIANEYIKIYENALL
jgi:hypothetical protein